MCIVPACADTPKGWAHSRRHFIAVQLDGAYRLKALVPVLESLVAQVQRDPAIGIGLVSMLGFEDTAKTLKVQPCRPASWNVNASSPAAYARVLIAGVQAQPVGGPAHSRLAEGSGRSLQ